VCHNVTQKRAAEEPDEPPRKERVIHTRVPESLEAELRQKAHDLGISVSNLVRNVLGHAVGLVDDVASSYAHARGTARTPAREPAPPPDSAPAPAVNDVLGWQPIVLGKNAVCAHCNAILPRGCDAATGVTEATATRFVICLVCLEQLRT